MARSSAMAAIAMAPTGGFATTLKTFSHPSSPDRSKPPCRSRKALASK